MKTNSKSIFTYHAIRNAYNGKNGAVPERYELYFIDADTHEQARFVVDTLPSWVNERPDGGFLIGDLECTIEKDVFNSQGNNTVYRTIFAQYTDREPATLA